MTTGEFVLVAVGCILGLLAVLVTVAVLVLLLVATLAGISLLWGVIA